MRKIACPLSKTANSAPTVEKINFFYKRPDLSITLGCVRSVAKDGIIRRYLQQTIKDTYQRFRTEDPENNLSFSHFAKLRPPTIKLASQLPMQLSVCERCANVDIALKSLGQSLTEKVKAEFVLTNKHIFLAKTLCQKGADGYYTKACYERKCNRCGFIKP